MQTPRAEALEALKARAEQAISRAHRSEAREAAGLLHEEIARWQAQLAGEPQGAQEVPEALSERFPDLARAYGQAAAPSGRVQAILRHYPLCQLSHAQFPQGQPGYVEGEPELTMRNLFTLAVKVGTDALKADTGTELFSQVMDRYAAVERHYPERVRSVPHTKQTARLMHDKRFDPRQIGPVLDRIPTMAGGVMSVSVEVLSHAGLLPAPIAPQATVRARVEGTDLHRAAVALAQQAEQRLSSITTGLQAVAYATGVRLAGLEHRARSVSSLRADLEQQVGLKRKTLAEAVAGVNDALRYCVVIEPEPFTERYRQVLARLDEQGHRRIRVVNHFAKATAPFSAVSVTLRDLTGELCWEIQFHTPKTFDLKNLSHDLHKESRTQRLASAPPPALLALMRPALQAVRGVAMPPGCDEIDDWEAQV